MKIIVAVLVLVAALANGQGGEDMAAKIGKMMENNKCSELFKQFAKYGEECKDFQSAHGTEEEIEAAEQQYNEENKPEMGDQGKEGKGGKGHGGKGGFGGKMGQIQRCVYEKMELIDAGSKSLIADKMVGLLEPIPDEAVRAELTSGITECTSAATSSKLPFVGQGKCICRVVKKVCFSRKQE